MRDYGELGRRVEELVAGTGEGAGAAGGEDGNEKSLNWLMEKLTVGLLPPSHLGAVLDVRSDASLEDAIRLLSTHGILSAPVRDVAAPEDASWIDRYLGVVDFPGIVLWVLDHHSVQVLKTPGRRSHEGGFPPPAAVEAADAPAGAENGAEQDLFSLLQSSAELRSTKVSDISGSFRWAPFLPLTRDDTLLTLLLMVSAYRARAVPIVEVGQGPLANIVTQTSVTHLLSALMGGPSFQGSWASRPISDLGLPCVTRDQLIKVEEKDPVLEPFRLMHRKGIGGVPVVRQGTQQVVGSIGVRDIQLLLLHPRLLHQHRTLMVSEFMELARKSVQASEATSVQKAALTVSETVSLGDLLKHMEQAHSPRAYVTDSQGDLLGVVTLRDVISRLVTEPAGYFGDFFQGVAPAILQK